MEDSAATYPVARTMLVGAVFDAWDDFDRALDGIDANEATRRAEDGLGSSFAWTVAHVTELVDSWVNVRFQGLEAHPLISQPQFRAGGSGIADDWHAVIAAVAEVRSRAAQYLALLTDEHLARSIPYAGSVRGVRQRGHLPLRYTLLRIIAHHYLHIGEIELKRRQLGRPVDGDFPGQLFATLAAERN